MLGKIEVTTDTPTEFELVDTATDIQRRREKAEKQPTEERANEEAIVDFVKDHELYDKTHMKFKDTARRDCLFERFSSSCRLTVQIPKDSLWKMNPVQIWPGSKGNDREVDLDSGQIYF